MKIYINFKNYCKAKEKNSTKFKTESYKQQKRLRRRWLKYNESLKQYQ